MAVRTYVRINGTLGSSNDERFSLGWNFATDTPLTSTEIGPAAAAVAAAIETWEGGANSGTLMNLLSAQGTIRTVDLYAYPATGDAVASASAAPSAPLPGFGTAAAPPQTCAVYTLITAVTGASYRGRVYWPALLPSMGTSLRSTDAINGRTGMVALLAEIQAALDVTQPHELGVYSPKLNVVTPVTGIRGGDVLDTQRRRRDTLIETYLTSQYPA